MTHAELRHRLLKLYGPTTNRQLALKFASDIGYEHRVVQRWLVGDKRPHRIVDLALEALEGR